MGSAPLGHLGEVGTVLVAHGLLLAARRQLFDRELADRIEHAVARGAVRPLFPLDQTLVDKGADGVEDGHLVRQAADGRGRRQVEAAGEDAQAGEQRPLAPVQQTVAPGDRGSHGPEPLRQIARAAGQQGQAPVEPGQERPRRQQIEPGRGELDRQRQAVQPPDDLGHGRRVAGGEHEVGADVASALGKEGDRRRGQQG